MKKENAEEVRKLRALFPQTLAVHITRSEDEGFIARIDTFKGLLTEADNFSELIEMVNDAVKTYYEIPKKFLPYMPNYIPPLEVVRLLDIFPVTKIKKDIVLPISNSEKVAC